MDEQAYQRLRRVERMIEELLLLEGYTFDEYGRLIPPEKDEEQEESEYEEEPETKTKTPGTSLKKKEVEEL